MAGRLTQSGSTRFHLNQNSEINVTPFVDIMLVLLIIFMVALPAATNSMNIDIPPAHGEAGAAPTYVSLQRDGAVFIGERATSLSRLPTDLERVIGGAHPKAQRVYVRAERGVRYGDFVGLVSQLHRNGFNAIGLVSETL